MPKPQSAISKIKNKAHPSYLPVWEVVIILLIFPPIAWYYMWKHRSYHSWLANSLFIYALATLVVGLYLFFFQFTAIRDVYRLVGIPDSLPTEQIIISIPIFLSVTLLIGAVFLRQQIKHRGKLTQNQLTLTLCIIILYSIVIPAGYSSYSFFSSQNGPKDMPGIIQKIQKIME